MLICLLYLDIKHTLFFPSSMALGRRSVVIGTLGAANTNTPLLVSNRMGIRSGRTGWCVPQSKNQHGTPPEFLIFQYLLFLARMQILFSNIFFKRKWPKPEKKLKFGGRWVWLSEPVPPIKTSWRRPCPTVLSLPSPATTAAVELHRWCHFIYTSKLLV